MQGMQEIPNCYILLIRYIFPFHLLSLTEAWVKWGGEYLGRGECGAAGRAQCDLKLLEADVKEGSSQLNLKQ